MLLRIATTASGQTLPDPVVIGKDRIAPTEIIDSDGLTNLILKKMELTFMKA